MIKTVLCFAYVVAGVIGLVPIGLLVVILSFLGLRRPMSVVMYRLAQGWARLFMRVVGCRMTVIGRENIPARGGLCFASNHASLVDILMLLAYAGRPIGFIAKKELRAIPILGMWIYIIGGLFVDRNSPRKALRTIAEGARRIKAGGAMVIFPEGSRSRGAGLLPFRPGAFKLASQSEATVVPVALCGTYDVFERNRRACACPVTVEFCAPVRVADLPMEARKTALCEMVRETISASLERSERAHSAQSQGGGKG